jgi:glutaminyl-peptide cyclotransferase
MPSFLLCLFACSTGLQPASVLLKPATPLPISSTALPTSILLSFDGEHAYQEYLMAQMNLGPRPVGSAADRATGDYIVSQLKQSGAVDSSQEFVYQGVPIRNIIGKFAIGRGPITIVGAHYDTRALADQDKEHPDAPMPGADDGASGVAVLLELARTLDVARLNGEVWLAFLDAEDNGGLDNCALEQSGVSHSSTAAPCDKSVWPFSVGASYLAQHLSSKPSAVVILDMIGDQDQQMWYEQNSDPGIEQQIWSVAARLGYSKEFIPQPKWRMDDDHTPFLQLGIRAVDIIDFDYPYWHTTQDTADKVSPDSLERVGRVMEAWLQGE